jgi:hypothetical protein
MENENLNSKELKEVPDFSTELKKLKKIKGSTRISINF